MDSVSTTKPSAEERNWAVIAHLSALAGLVIWGLGIVLGPLIVWLLKKDQMPFVDEQGKEALNFQITVFLAGVVCSSLIFLLIGVPLLVPSFIYEGVHNQHHAKRYYGTVDDPEYLHAPFVDLNARLLELFDQGDTATAARDLEGYLIQSERMVLSVYSAHVD